jgi:23S rRNA pseudouridine1911/1915/1917 synthase
MTAELDVGPDGAGVRLDVFVASALGLSRTRVQRLLDEDRIRLDGRAPRKSEVLTVGQRVAVDVPPPAALAAEPEPIPLTIVFQDADLVVVDKPAGLVVHPSAGHARGTLVNALLHHVHDLSGIGGALRPGIVHRLDKDTSGLMVVAKSDAAHQALSDALKRRRVRRLYQAAVWGHLDEPTLLVDAPIMRDPRERRRMAVVEGGRRAVTRARVRERWRAAELLDVALETGRTHQIRVHLAHVGHPVVGDRVYGAGWEKGMGGRDRGWARELARKVSRQFLHASELVFDHPRTGGRLRFRSPLPPDLAEAAAWARETGE